MQVIYRVFGKYLLKYTKPNSLRFVHAYSHMRGGARSREYISCVILNQDFKLFDRSVAEIVSNIVTLTRKSIAHCHHIKIQTLFPITHIQNTPHHFFASQIEYTNYTSNGYYFIISFLYKLVQWKSICFGIHARRVVSVFTPDPLWKNSARPPPLPRSIAIRAIRCYSSCRPAKTSSILISRIE